MGVSFQTHRPRGPGRWLVAARSSTSAGLRKARGVITAPSVKQNSSPDEI